MPSRSGSLAARGGLHLVADRLIRQSAWSATPVELASLWAVVSDSAHVDTISDGARRWAFFLDFTRRQVPGVQDFTGAILIAEEGQGPLSARLYFSRGQLADAWAACLKAARQGRPL